MYYKVMPLARSAKQTWRKKIDQSGTVVEKSTYITLDATATSTRRRSFTPVRASSTCVVQCVHIQHVRVTSNGRATGS